MLQAAVPSVQIIRAVLREYHAATHTAEVEPVLGPASLVGEIPVLMSCRPDLLTEGREVAVLTWSDVGGLVLGPHGSVPDDPPNAGDADTVDGMHATATAAADKLLALNGDAKLPASVTGDADTVDGIHAASTPTASKLLAMDADAKFPAHTVGGDLKVCDGDVQIWDSSSLGSETIINGGFDADTDWTKYGTASISGGKAHLPAYGDSIRQSLVNYTAGIGQLLKFVYTISNSNDGTLKIPNYSRIDTFMGSDTSIPSGDETHTEYLVSSDAGGTGIEIKSYGFTGDLDDVSLKPVTGGDLIVRGLITGGRSLGIKVLNDGKVGISDTSPSELLDVNGNVRADDFIEFSPIFIGDALAALRGIRAVPGKGNWREVDHESLPERVRHIVRERRWFDKRTGEEMPREFALSEDGQQANKYELREYERACRSLSATVQLQQRAIIQLLERVESLEQAPRSNGVQAP